MNEDWLFRCSLKSQPVTWAVRTACGGVFARVARFQIRAWHGTLPIANGERFHAEVYVLNPEAQAFSDTEPRAV